MTGDCGGGERKEEILEQFRNPIRAPGQKKGLKMTPSSSQEDH